MNNQVNHFTKKEMAVKDFIHNCLIQKGEQIIGHICRELENYYDADDVGIYETNKDYTQINSYKRSADGTIRKHDASSEKLKKLFAWLANKEEFGLSVSFKKLDKEASMLLELLKADHLLIAPIKGSERIDPSLVK